MICSQYGTNERPLSMELIWPWKLHLEENLLSFDTCFQHLFLFSWHQIGSLVHYYTWSKLCIRFLIKTKSLALVQIFFFKAGYELICLFFRIFKWCLLVLISVDYWNKRYKCLYWFFILLLDTTLCLVSNTCKISRKLSHIITLLKVHIVFFFFLQVFFTAFS